LSRGFKASYVISFFISIRKLLSTSHETFNMIFSQKKIHQLNPPKSLTRCVMRVTKKKGRNCGRTGTPSRWVRRVPVRGAAVSCVPAGNGRLPAGVTEARQLVMSGVSEKISQSASDVTEARQLVLSQSQRPAPQLWCAFGSMLMLLGSTAKARVEPGSHHMPASPVRDLELTHSSLLPALYRVPRSVSQTDEGPAKAGAATPHHGTMPCMMVIIVIISQHLAVMMREWWRAIGLIGPPADPLIHCTASS
jgi:hypothetical protein